MLNANVPLDSLSNADLLSATRDLITKSHVLEADLLLHLGEIDDRRLYLDSRFPSMFAFCVDELGFSEDAAYNRITVARAGRRLPAILDALRSGSVHLAGLRLLAPHLNELNHELVLPQAAGRSKRDIEELVARLAPAPPVRTGIRRVPESAVASWSPIPAHLAPTTPMPAAAQGATSFSFAKAQAPFPVCGMAAPACATETEAPTAPTAAPPFAEPAPAFRHEPRSLMAPLTGETFKVQFTATRELRDKLLEARALLRHRVPDGDLSTIIEKGLDLLIEKVKKERFAVGRKVRARTAPSAKRSGSQPPEADVAPPAEAAAPPPTEAAGPPPAEAPEPPPTASPAVAPETDGEQADSEATGASEGPDEQPFPAGDASPDVSESRRIPDAIKRAVYERDGGRCTFVDHQGRRCESMEAPEFDHVHGFARTGVHRVEDIRLRCPAHNQAAAEKMYGREFMERARAKGPPAPDQ
jgi:hypothetical protein